MTTFTFNGQTYPIPNRASVLAAYETLRAMLASDLRDAAEARADNLPELAAVYDTGAAQLEDAAWTLARHLDRFARD